MSKSSVVLSTMALADAETGRDLLTRLDSLGMPAIEVDFHMADTHVDALLHEHRCGTVVVNSVHNCNPKYVGTKYRYNTGLSSLDDDLRRLSVADTCYSLELTALFSAANLVMPLGRIDPPIHAESTLRRLHIQGRQHSAEFAALRQQVIDERARLVGKYLDAARRSLDVLVPQAQSIGVRICLENRYEFGKLPLAGDFQMLRNEYGDTLGYCHDTGHAGNLHYLDLDNDSPVAPSIQFNEWHIADVSATTLKDHLPLGEGDLNLHLLAEEVQRRDADAVVELRHQRGDHAVRESLDLVSQWLRDSVRAVV